MTLRDMLRAIIQNSPDTALVLNAAKMQTQTDEQMEQRRNRVRNLAKQALWHRDAFPDDAIVELEALANEVLNARLNTRNRSLQMRFNPKEMDQIRALANRRTAGDASKLIRVLADKLWSNSNGRILDIFEICIQRTAGQSPVRRNKTLRIRSSDSEMALLSMLADRHTRGNVSWLVRAMVEWEGL